MRQRGRPPHPDILTPREWEVLSLLREGLSNRDIGDRLGVTRDGIKYHVAQILLKLGVATREEAAAWQSAAPVNVAPSSRLAARLSGISRMGLIGTAGVLLTGLAALAGAVVYNEIAVGGSPTDPAEVSAGGPPTASPGPYGVPTPTPVAAVLTDAGDGSLGQVAYVKDGNLWMLNLDTGEDRMIVQREVAKTFGTTAQDLTLLEPEWSPDGQWVSFGVRNAAVNDATSIWVVRPGDGLLEGAGDGWNWEWSPVDDLIAGGFGSAGLMRPADSIAPGYYSGTNNSFGWNVGQGEGRWSPDGRYLAVPDALGPRLDPQKSDAGSAPYVLRLIDTQTASGPTMTPTDNQPGVTTIFKEDSAPGPLVVHSWSPDGKYILFWKGPGDAHMGDMALVSVEDPSNIKIIGQAREVPSVAAWSPDGSLLAFVDSGSKLIQLMTPGGDVRATFGLADSAASEPAWSPSGERLAFVQGGRIWTALSDGSSEPAEITNDASYSDRDPQWSRGGSRIAFVRLSADAVVNQVAGPAELWIMNADGSDAHKIGDLPSINLQTHGLGGFDVDWSQYLSWYRPSRATVQTPTATPYRAPTPTTCDTCSFGQAPTATPYGTPPPPTPFGID
jgi:Tol biopolymer transport system component/DNA-binding CsgD family transcriptional regulator